MTDAVQPDSMTNPGGWVVIEFGAFPSDVCAWPQCPMSATWFASEDAARAYMATRPRWTEPHCLPLCTLRPQT